MKRPRDIEDYLAGLPEAKRKPLQRLRSLIKAVAPGAEECLSYQVPAFRLEGRALVAFGAAAGHCSFYPMSAAAITAHDKELADFSTSRGTIRFIPESPLPADLVRKIVRYRIAENRTKSPGAGCRPRKGSKRFQPRKEKS